MTKTEFKILFDSYYNSLCNYANAILSDYDKSEDVVQDILFNFWEKRNDLSIEQDKYENYLIRSVKFKCIDVHRQKKVVRKYEAEIIHENNSITEDSNEDLPDYKAILLKAIDELPEKTKQVFMMSKIEGLKYQEIADSQGISIKTVENQMGRALKHLRLILKKEQLFNILMFFILFK